MVELTVPAGSLQSALNAFSEGGDGVYLGLKRFSARTGATNLSIEELAKLRTVALKENKKIHLTINTLVTDEELFEVVATLKEVERIGVDGIIVQDLGIARIIRDAFPSLPLHGSTQLAVHTVEGVRRLQKWGFERIVLARELTLDEIDDIRKACPDVELKVFIHGALCYAFSGLCMASHYLADRSANRGACAQVCRTWWSVEEDPSFGSPLGEGPRNAPFFSMSDLRGIETIDRLKKMGIDSLKIEGRMKSPAYAHYSAQAYRKALDGQPVDLDPLSITFARTQGTGWLSGYGRRGADFSLRHTPSLSSGNTASHMGIEAGTILDHVDHEILVALKRPVADRDGVMYLAEDRLGLFEPVRFAVRGVGLAEAGARIWIPLPNGVASPAIGSELRLVSGHDLNVPLISEEISPYQKPIDLTVILEDSKLTIRSRAGSAEAHVALQKAHRNQDLEHNLATIFSQSDRALFTLGSLNMVNKSSLKDEEIFLPLSTLKKIRRAFYQSLDRRFERYVGQPIDFGDVEKKEWQPLPKRSLLVDGDRVPYLDPTHLRKRIDKGKPLEELLFPDGAQLYFPLAPITFREDRFFEDLGWIIDRAEKEESLRRIRFGLNNVAHIRFFEERQLPVFCDIYLYLANSHSARLIGETDLNLIGGYHWLERFEGDTALWPFEPTFVDPSFQAPLFISRSCFRYDSLGLGCEGCPRSGSWYVNQHDKKARVIVRECITTLLDAERL
ncbi:MAG: U32 family peptidase [Spirochaetales bacterium]|nr:U32 family peptidase [Spirochaetales bacterium]